MDDHQNKFGSLYELKGQRQSTNINVRAAFVHVLGIVITVMLSFFREFKEQIS